MRTALTLDEIEERATQFFNNQGYSKGESEQNKYELLYRNGKNINWVLMILIFLLITFFTNILWALGAVIVYYLICGDQEVTILLRQETSATEVTAMGNSTNAQVLASNFLLQLPQL
jgi:hypothetical protein